MLAILSTAGRNAQTCTLEKQNSHSMSAWLSTREPTQLFTWTLRTKVTILRTTMKSFSQGRQRFEEGVKEAVRGFTINGVYLHLYRECVHIADKLCKTITSPFFHLHSAEYSLQAGKHHSHPDINTPLSPGTCEAP